jgi:hypothetical protein
MSPQEVQFIRAYALALKRHFGEFCSALHLMRTDVGVKCPVRAAALARELEEFQAQFEHAMTAVADKHQPKVKELPEFPGVDALVQLIQISFFAVSDEKNSAKFDGHSGWYSGHPLSWETIWEKEHNPQEPPPKAGQPMTAILNAFFKLLGFSSTINHVPGFPYKKLPPPEMHQSYEDDYDEDEDDNNFDYYTDEG